MYETHFTKNITPVIPSYNIISLNYPNKAAHVDTAIQIRTSLHFIHFL